MTGRSTTPIPPRRPVAAGNAAPLASSHPIDGPTHQAPQENLQREAGKARVAPPGRKEATPRRVTRSMSSAPPPTKSPKRSRRGDAAPSGKPPKKDTTQRGPLHQCRASVVGHHGMWRMLDLPPGMGLRSTPLQICTGWQTGQTCWQSRGRYGKGSGRAAQAERVEYTTIMTWSERCVAGTPELPLVHCGLSASAPPSPPC